MAKECCVPQRRCNHVVPAEVMWAYEIGHWAEGLAPGWRAACLPPPPPAVPCQAVGVIEGAQGGKRGLILTLQQAGVFPGSLLPVAVTRQQVCFRKCRELIHVRNNSCFASLGLDFSIGNWEYYLHTEGTQRKRRWSLFGDTLESTSVVQSFILSIIIKHILRVYYVSGFLLSNANTEIDKVTGPVLKGLIIYTHIFHQKNI